MESDPESKVEASGDEVKMVGEEVNANGGLNRWKVGRKAIVEGADLIQLSRPPTPRCR